MAAFKNKANGTWYVQFRYTDWKGERQQKVQSSVGLIKNWNSLSFLA